MRGGRVEGGGGRGGVVNRTPDTRDGANRAIDALHGRRNRKRGTSVVARIIHAKR